jgi:hypothetical protein
LVFPSFLIELSNKNVRNYRWSGRVCPVVSKEKTNMADKTTKTDPKPVEPTPAKVDAPDIQPIPVADIQESEQPTEKELHAHDHGSQNLNQNHRAEQQLKNQQNAQNDRELFPKGLAQEHGKGRG